MQLDCPGESGRTAALDEKMLSLAKLQGGTGASYWLAQAQGRVTHAESVSSGVEDYYLAGPEAVGQWTGGGLDALELGGEVAEEALTRLLDRQDPRTAEPLPRPPGRRAEVDGFDLMFSVPKSASVLFALGDIRAQGAVLRAQRAAVVEAMSYLDQEACLVRVGSERELQRGAGLVGAAFEHRTSRAGDPQVHTHVLIANGTRRADGKWAALHGSAIYQQARTAGHIHEAAFRRALALELGVEWGRVHNGIADVDGFTSEQLQAFSTRSSEIDDYLDEHGWTGAEARQIAALRTREAKDYDVTPEMLLPEWRQRAQAVGIDEHALRAMVDRQRYRPLGPQDQEDVTNKLAGPGGLTRQASSFDRRDVICAFAAAAQQGATLDEVEAWADAFLADPRVVALHPGPEGRLSHRDVLRLDDGRVVPAVAHATRYTTRELLSLEREVIDRAVNERAVGAAVAAPQAIERAIATRPTIGTDQAEMVRRLCSDGHRIQVVVGPPGTGKTFALDAAREAWQASGYVVVGAAVAREAARNLEEKSGIPATSVAAVRAQLAQGGEYGLGPRSVLIVDEAGMLPTHDLHALVAHASGAGAAIVFVGDHHQLPEIDAGGTFRGLVIRAEPIVLTENRRQQEEWGRRMLERIRSGEVRQGLELASEHGVVRVSGTAEGAGAELVRDWWEARQAGQQAVMLAYRRQEVHDFNAAGHALMDAAGKLGAERLLLAAGEFAAGDEVLLRRRSMTAQVNNGSRGTITAIDVERQEATVRLPDDQRLVRLDADYLRQPGVNGQPSMLYGYAATVHTYQGATTEATFAYGSPGLYRELVYTASSRHEHSLRFYLADPDIDRELAEFHGAQAEPQDAFERFVAQAQQSRAQHAAVDEPHREWAASLSLADLHTQAERFERVAARSPRPRLERELAQAEITLAGAQRTAAVAAERRVGLEAQLQAQRRPGRDAKRELAQAQAIEHDAQVAAGKAAERVHDARACLQADRWPLEHAEDLARLTAVRDEILTRAQRQVIRARHVEVPGYLVDELGERPGAPKARGTWDRAAIRIEHYRNSFDVTDPDSALGPRPRELRALGAYDQARRDIDAAKARLAHDLGLEHEGHARSRPSHGLGR